MPMLRSHCASLIVACFALSLSACVQQAPPDLVQAVESLDRRLMDAQSARFAPTEYATFATHWVAIKGRLLAEEDAITWPWEANPLLADLKQVQEEGQQALEESLQRQDSERQAAESRLALLEGRLRLFSNRVDEIGSRVVLGKRPVATELLARQARAFLDEGLFARSEHAIRLASRLIDDQATVLTTELGRYADARLVETWRRMAARTVEWSRTHHAAAIVISKADRRLTLYRNGRQALTYPVRLGYNGIFEKRYQGDGATPEGQYRVVRKRDLGQTQFYRAFLLDYPNAEDRRSFQQARRRGTIPAEAFIGGQIEIHGGDDYLLSQTLGCVMLDNPHIDVLFRQVEVGTPVTIVGAMKVKNSVSLALADLDSSEEG